VSPWFKAQVIQGVPGDITFGLIKPDAYDEHRDILNLIEYEYKLYVSKMVTLIFKEDDVRSLYYAHIKKDFYHRNEKHMMSGPSLCMAIHGPDALIKWRQVIMPTIRETRGDRDCLLDHQKHLTKVHGSDSEENAFRELQYFFG
jgi:nucleoside diphosphate kinase